MTVGGSAEDEVIRQTRLAQDHLERARRAEVRAGKFEKGRQGELVVAAELDLLRNHGYGFVADVRWPGTIKGNVDFLVFGPAGAFVVDAKNWSGAITVPARGILRQNGYRRDRETGQGSTDGRRP